MGAGRPGLWAHFLARCLLSLALLLGLSAAAIILLQKIGAWGRVSGGFPGIEAGLPPVLVSILDFLLSVAGGAGWAVVPGVIVFLLVRRLTRLALFITVTALGTMALDLVFAIVPPLAGASTMWTGAPGFLSASPLFTAAAVGAFVLVFLPAVPPRRRWWFNTGAVTAVLLTGSVDILVRETTPGALAAGWLAALLWLAAVGSAFRRWQRDLGLVRHPLGAGLVPSCRRELLPAPMQDTVLPSGARGAGVLAAAAALLCVALLAAGSLLRSSRTLLNDLDTRIVEWFAGHRHDTLTALASVLDHAGNTPGIVAVLLFAIPVILAATRRRAPAMVLLTATAGETTIFLVTQAVVGRERPAVAHLAGEPATSSFPSGHVAASVATYGCLALVVSAWTRYRVRWLLLLAAGMLVAAVAVTRIYLGMHYPTDIMASLLFAPTWLAVCWYVLQPARGSPGLNEERSKATAYRNGPKSH